MSTLRVGIPAFRERDWLPHTLADLARQRGCAFEVWVCVNQPAEWFDDPHHRHATEENLDTLAWLTRRQNAFPFRLHVLDAVRPPHAPPASIAGVGWARRTLFARITSVCRPREVCVSLDADTSLEPDYLAKVGESFQRHANAVALAAPYYHPQPEELQAALNLLRYEIYGRYYQLNLWRIGSPYAFLPLGSALAFRAGSYLKARGFSPRQAGEDFYLLQQLRKLGPVIRWVDSVVSPAARVSDRVPFGTGQQLHQPDLRLQEARYPLYDPESFDLVGETFRRFADLHRGPVRLPVHAFIETKMKGYGAFDRMRRNFADRDRFIRACHDKFDGLRSLQFLRFDREQHGPRGSASRNLECLLSLLGKPSIPIDFKATRVAEFAHLRNKLFQYESDFQRNFMRAWDFQAKW